MTTPPIKPDLVKPGPVKRIIRILSIFLLMLLTCAIIGTAIFHEQVFRLYHVLTLFEPDKIVHNFQNMDTIFMTRTIKAPATPSPLGQDKRPLPTSFVYKGESINSGQFLEDTWTTGFIIPKQWVQDSVTPDAPHLMPGENPLSSWIMGYGYQWWIPETSVKKIKTDYMAIGVYNQYIYIHPPSRTVVVKLSAYPDYNTDGSEKTLRTVELFRTIAQEM